jgi:hypothetical protein
VTAVKLELAGEPVIIAPEALPGHRILRVHVRNAGDRAVELRRTHLRLFDEHGADLRAAARPPLVHLEPGHVAGLDLVYRVRDGTGAPAHLEHVGADNIDITSARHA